MKDYMKKPETLPVPGYKKHKRRRVKRNLFLSAVLITGCLVILSSIASGTVHGENTLNDIETVPKMPVEIPQSSKAPTDVEKKTTDTPWYLTLVNRENPLPEDYLEYQIHLVDVPGSEKVDERIYDPLMEMLDAAGELGPIVVSGYRTAEKQQSLYDEKMKEYQRQGYSESEAIELAQQWVAEPGTSEHQLGLSVDINGASYDIYLWLQENSYKYGFIFRYPGNKTDITGVAEEVWHYRYVGKEAARAIYERGICLEEYLENPQSANSQASQEPDSQESFTQNKTAPEAYELYEGEWIPAIP